MLKIFTNVLLHVRLPTTVYAPTHAQRWKNDYGRLPKSPPQKKENARRTLLNQFHTCLYILTCSKLFPNLHPIAIHLWNRYWVESQLLVSCIMYPINLKYLWHVFSFPVTSLTLDFISKLLQLFIKITRKPSWRKGKCATPDWSTAIITLTRPQSAATDFHVRRVINREQRNRLPDKSWRYRKTWVSATRNAWWSRARSWVWMQRWDDSGWCFADIANSCVEKHTRISGTKL